MSEGLLFLKAGGQGIWCLNERIAALSGMHGIVSDYPNYIERFLNPRI
jgi:hypothetical protein